MIMQKLTEKEKQHLQKRLVYSCPICVSISQKIIGKIEPVEPNEETVKWNAFTKQTKCVSKKLQNTIQTYAIDTNETQNHVDNTNQKEVFILDNKGEKYGDR